MLIFESNSFPENTFQNWANLVAFQLWFLPAQQILEAQIYENKIQKGKYLQEPFAFRSEIGKQMMRQEAQEDEIKLVILGNSQFLDQIVQSQALIMLLNFIIYKHVNMYILNVRQNK